jgi:GH25 family lysozyme M1 (1,4-beta-N-acetylmuramidase)
MIQARVVDVHRYYRTGGIDWDKLKVNFDAVIISAGVGMNANPLLPEQVSGAVAHGVPYMTYHLPSPIFPMSTQVEFYLGLYGVKDSATCIDIEPPVSNGSIRCINAAEALAYIKAVENATGKKPIVYSNPKNINEAIKRPTWLADYWLWIAQWPYDILTSLFRNYDRFLAKYANAYPPFVKGTVWQANTLLWQFTCKGDAQALCASATTADPVYKVGIKDADLNVSTLDKSIFLSMLNTPQPPSPPQSWEQRADAFLRTLGFTGPEPE